MRNFIWKQLSFVRYKPLTFLGITGIISFPINFVIHLILNIIHWNSMVKSFGLKNFWFILFYIVLVDGFFLNAVILICFTLTSPSVSLSTFPFRLMFLVLFSQIFKWRELAVLQHILCSVSLFGFSIFFYGIFFLFN